ncbi:MAG: hypothetical protein WAX67_07680, partial [Rugosibacter sp.]
MIGRLPLLLIGLIAVGVDSAVFQLFHMNANSLGLAHIAGFFAALAVGLALLAVLDQRLRALPFKQWGMLGVLALLTLFLRGGLLGSLTQIVGADEATALQGGRAINALLAVADGDTAAAVMTALFSMLLMYAGYRWLA